MRLGLSLKDEQNGFELIRIRRFLGSSIDADVVISRAMNSRKLDAAVR